jgi:hypothetical protein
MKYKSLEMCRLSVDATIQNIEQLGIKINRYKGIASTTKALRPMNVMSTELICRKDIRVCKFSVDRANQHYNYQGNFPRNLLNRNRTYRRGGKAVYVYVTYWKILWIQFYYLNDVHRLNFFKIRLTKPKQNLYLLCTASTKFNSLIWEMKHVDRRKDIHGIRCSIAVQRTQKHDQRRRWCLNH